MTKLLDQNARDHNRRAYRIVFPPDLDEKRVTAWVRSISGTLRQESLFGALMGMPSLALEVWGTPDGISWWIKIPFSYVEPVKLRLEALVPGISLIHDEEPPGRVWVKATELKLTAGHRPLNIPVSSDISTALLSTMGAVGTGETLMCQWVISPAIPEHKPQDGAYTKENSFSAFWNGSKASKDEINDRRDKLDEPNMQTVVRIGAVANTRTRADRLLKDVIGVFNTTRGASNHFQKRAFTQDMLQDRINRAVTPLVMPVLLAAPELAALLGWPLDNPEVPGMPAPGTRRIPVPVTVPREGIVLGVSNYPGRERPVAVGFKEALVHGHIVGPPGQGKTALLANMFKQMVDAKRGVVVVESSGNLIEECLKYVPSDRVNDVIHLSVNDLRMPLGFNILQQGDKSIIVDEISKIFKLLYKDHPSMWAEQALYHGLSTLVEDGHSTFIDLLALVSPVADEVAWSDELRRKVKDPQHRRYWQGLEKEGKTRMEQKVEPLANRVWVMERSSLRNIVGQEQSTFYMRDVVKQNKILLVNLAGIEETAASIMGTIIMSLLWTQVKANPMPDSPNYLLLDEAHRYMNVPFDLANMFVEARKFGLGVFAAHQQLSQLTPTMKSALTQSAQTKVFFQTGASDAREIAQVLGSGFPVQDIERLAKYEAVVRVATPSGVSPAFTMKTKEPATPYSLQNQVVYASRSNYARPQDWVEEQIEQRRQREEQPKRRPHQSPNVEGFEGL